MSCLSKISCFATRRVLSSMSTKPPGGFVLSNLAGRISNLMLYSTKYIPYGTPPAQTPLVGSPEWEAMLKNVEDDRNQPPLSPVDIERVKKMRKMEKHIDQIEKKFQKIMESNKRLREELHNVRTIK